MSKDIISEILDYPPPYCNGSLHLGHLYESFLYYVYYNLSDEQTLNKNCSKFTKLILDNIDRKKKNVTLNLGVDVNGLPISLKIKKELESNNKLVDLKEFKSLCDNLIDLNSKKMYELFDQINILNLRNVNKYSTKDDNFKSFTKRVFNIFKENKLISTARRPQLYCANCKTFLAHAEVESIDCFAKEYTLTFYDELGNSYEVMSKLPEYVIAAIGLAYNPADNRYKHLKGKTLSTTVKNNVIKVPVYESNWVHQHVGTGLTFFCAWAGQIDFKIINDLNLKVVSSIHDAEGQFKPELKQKFKFDSIKQLTQFFTPELKLVNDNTTIKKLLHTERSNCCKQVIYLDSDQVYLELTTVQKNKLKELLKSTVFEPKDVFNQLLTLIDKYNGWCLSRTNRYYSFEEEFDGKNFKIDTWLISALTPWLRSSENVSTVRLQGADIVKTWGFYTFLISMLTNVRSLDKLIIHKMIVDPYGAKFSKSSNNAPDLTDLLKTIPLKVLRFYFLEKPLDKDIRFNLKEIEDLKKFFTKLKNVKLKLDLEISRKNITIEKSNSLELKIESEILGLLQNEKPNNTKIAANYYPFFNTLRTFFEKDIELFKFSAFMFKIKSLVYAISNNLKNDLSDYELILNNSILKIVTDILKAYE